MEISDSNYRGLEINFVELIFRRLNLTAQYIMLPNTKDIFHPMFIRTIQQVEPSSSDIAIGLLTFQLHMPLLNICSQDFWFANINVFHRFCNSSRHYNADIGKIRDAN
jgi:hypothetical protein